MAELHVKSKKYCPSSSSIVDIESLISCCISISLIKINPHIHHIHHNDVYDVYVDVYHASIK